MQWLGRGEEEGYDSGVACGWASLEVAGGGAEVGGGAKLSFVCRRDLIGRRRRCKDAGSRRHRPRVKGFEFRDIVAGAGLAG